MITFDLEWIQVIQLFVLPVLLPMLVGFVTTKVTDSSLKSVLLLALSGVTALVSELVAALQTGDPYNLGMGLFMMFVTFVSGVAVYYGLLKPTGAAEVAQRNGVKPKNTR